MTADNEVPGAGSPPSKAKGSPADLTSVLSSRGYHALLLAAALIGLPIAAIAFGFLAAMTATEKWVWQTLPAHFGWDQPNLRLSWGLRHAGVNRG